MSDADKIGAFRDEFGFLFEQQTITFKQGTIIPIRDYPKNKCWVEERLLGEDKKFLFPLIRCHKTTEDSRKHSHPISGAFGKSKSMFQSLFYPFRKHVSCYHGIVKKVFRESSTKRKPGTSELELISSIERPDDLWRLPKSHELRLDVSGDLAIVRMGIGGLILYLLSYLYGTRLQFEGWWVDKRIPIKSHNVGFDIQTVERFLSHACCVWETWPDEQKMWFMNILYMNSRSPSYKWHWEQFIINYMVFDACFALAMKLRPEQEKYWRKQYNGRILHKDRFEVMCNEYKLRFEKERIDEIYDLRNPLFHQGLLDESMPGMGERLDPIEEAHNLRRLNHRLIPALLDYPTDYIKTSWSSISPCWFDSRLRKFGPSERLVPYQENSSNFT